MPFPIVFRQAASSSMWTSHCTFSFEIPCLISSLEHNLLFLHDFIYFFYVPIHSGNIYGAPTRVMQALSTWDTSVIKTNNNINSNLCPEGLTMQRSACLLSGFRLVPPFATPGTVARQAPLSTGFSRQEHWSGRPCPPPGDLPDPGIEPTSPVFQVYTEQKGSGRPLRPLFWNPIAGTSLVVQWLRICLPMKGTWVRFPFQGDPTYCRTARPVHHNNWGPQKDTLLVKWS